MTYDEAQSKDTAFQLERLVDSCGLYDVISILADICQEKAQHIAENWQDEGLTNQWQQASEILNDTAEEKIVRVLP